MVTKPINKFICSKILGDGDFLIFIWSLAIDTVLFMILRETEM